MMKNTGLIKTILNLAGCAGLLLLVACNLPSAQQIVAEAQPLDLNVVLTELAEETQQPVTESTADPAPDAAPAPTQPLPTPASDPARTLTVCLGKEPQTLFFYDESSQAMWSVLESIYDGPFDVINGRAEPVIIEDIQVEKQPVTVMKDDVILDSGGDIVAIKSGIKLRPANVEDTCAQPGCELTWQNGLENVEMYQSVITFRLKSGLLWSDGEPLTAADSVYSMTVNGMKGIRASKKEFNLTESYRAIDETTLEWKGIPGYIPEQAADVFWTPLPRHLMSDMSVSEILSSELVNRAPIGWGAYQLAGWEAGSEIRAVRNPHYQAADGSTPWFDQLIFRFYGRAGDNNIQALKSGSCDIIDTSVDLAADLEPILEDVRDGKLSIYIQPENTWQQLTFGISSMLEDRPGGYADFFSSADVRTALQQCIDRKRIIRNVFYGQAEAALGFYPMGHIYSDATLAEVPYDPAAGAAALDAAGWKDQDGDALTPRTAEGVAGLVYGTKFALDLAFSDSETGLKVAEMIKADLAECGVEVRLQPEKLAQFFSQGPDGTLFGRRFDLATFAWSAGLSSPCKLYSSAGIPNAGNNWIGVNVGGFSSSEYDAACLEAELADPFDEGSLSKYKAVQKLYASALPVIPLYFDFSIGASANSICGIADSIGSRSLLWNLEQFSRSAENCAQSQWENIYEN